MVSGQGTISLFLISEDLSRLFPGSRGSFMKVTFEPLEAELCHDCALCHHSTNLNPNMSNNNQKTLAGD